LIEATVGTLRHALIEEVVLVTLAHVIFLMHFRSILIVTLPLPLAVLCSFLLMHYTQVTSNVMSLAGIAIAIGVLVDAGIVVTENAFRHLEGVDTRDRGKVWETVLRATKLVGRPTFFSMAIIVLAFVPVFALTGQEGKLFHPLAFAKTFAMASATAIALTLTAILCTLLLRSKFHSEDENPVMRFVQGLYRPASFESPRENGVAERWVESCRRDLLDHIIAVNERHLKRLLSEYVRDYHEDRTHLGLGKGTPNGRIRSVASGWVLSQDRLGGLQHRYDRAA
jgi:Cu/Ag efflux pump CusA